MCRQCDLQLFNQSCLTCNIFCFLSKQLQPSYHCEQCDKCEIGVSGYKQHCQKCRCCFINFQKHVCISDQICPICQDQIQGCQDGVVQLPCGHYLHKTCRVQLLEAQDVKCPICRKLLLSGQQRAAFDAVGEQKYLTEILPPVWEDYLVWASCNECSHRFVTQQHLVPCRCVNVECLSWNTTFRNPFQIQNENDLEEAKSIIKQ